MFDFILPPDPPSPVIILNDTGGRIIDYKNAAENYKAQGREVKIIGLCWSACTLALSVPNVCVGPMATVMFHYAFNTQTHQIDVSMTNFMLNQLPLKIKNEVAGKLKKEFYTKATLNSKQLINLGIKKCDNYNKN